MSRGRLTSASLSARLAACSCPAIPTSTSIPKICFGKPRVAGTRIRAVDVLDMIADGTPEAEMVADFPELGVENIRACVRFAAGFATHSVVLAA